MTALVRTIVAQIYDTFCLTDRLFYKLMEQSGVHKSGLKITELVDQHGFSTRPEFIESYGDKDLNHFVEYRFTIETLLRINGIGPAFAKQIFLDIAEHFLSDYKALRWRLILLNQGKDLPRLKLPTFLDSSFFSADQDFGETLSKVLPGQVHARSLVTTDHYNATTLCKMFDLNFPLIDHLLRYFSENCLIDFYTGNSLKEINNSLRDRNICGIKDEQSFLEIALPEYCNLLLTIHHLQQFQDLYADYYAAIANGYLNGLVSDGNYVFLQGLITVEFPVQRLLKKEFDGAVLSLTFGLSDGSVENYNIIIR